MIQETSRDAYRNINNLGDRQIQVLRELERHYNATNLELATSLGLPINQVCGRTRELVKLHMVKEDFKRRCNVSGMNVIAWKVNR